MASVLMMVGGAIVNAMAFSGSQYLFTYLNNSHADTERIRHDKAVEELQSAQAEWNQRRIERLDWLNEELSRRNHAAQTFEDVDAAAREYFSVTGESVDPLGREPELADFYTPSQDQKDNEITFVVLGMAITGLIAYGISRSSN